MKKLLLLFLLIGLSVLIKAQKSKKFLRVDKTMHLIPDSSTYSTQGIAGYINTEFFNQKDKARAIFIWIAENINYDYENMYADLNMTSDEILKSRKGICRDFTQLFSEIAFSVGIKTHTITGYTRKKKLVDYNMHSWCGLYIDSVWYLIDPTWGAGSIIDDHYTRKINNDYFMVRPDRFIKSHIPFDPLWQFSNYPITKKEFQKGISKSNNDEAFFNFMDTLSVYEKQTEIERLISICSRTKSNGISSYLDYDKIRHLNSEIKDSYNNRNIKQYNLALKNFNEGIILSNEYIDYQNKYYIPYKSDEDIIKMLDEIEQLFNLSLSQLKLIKNISSNLKINIDHLYMSIDISLNDLNDTKMKLEKYLKIAKDYRKSLSLSKELKSTNK